MVVTAWPSKNSIYANGFRYFYSIFDKSCETLTFMLRSHKSRHELAFLIGTLILKHISSRNSQLAWQFLSTSHSVISFSNKVSPKHFIYLLLLRPPLSDLGPVKANSLPSTALHTAVSFYPNYGMTIACLCINDLLSWHNVTLVLTFCIILKFKSTVWECEQLITQFTHRHLKSVQASSCYAFLFVLAPLIWHFREKRPAEFYRFLRTNV